MYSDDSNDDSMNDNIENEGSAEDGEDEETDGILEESEDDAGSDEEINAEDGSEDDAGSDEETNAKDGSEDDESMSEDQDDYDVDINNPLYRQRDSIKTISETNIKTEIEKGNSVRSQLKLWENLLEMRIKLQKCIVTSNQMPQYDTHKELTSNIDFIKNVNETKMKLSSTLNNMLQLRDLLLKQYPETKYLCTGVKKRKIGKNENTSTGDTMEDEIPSDTENESKNEEESSTDEDIEASKESVPRKRIKYKEYEKVLHNNHVSYTEYRDSVIKKWNDKTRIATGSLSKSSGHTTLKQIEFAMSDVSKLRKRAQLKRSEYNIVGKSSPNDDNDGRRIQEYDPEIYDDDDFYHQLLRDLIEYKSSDVTDPIQLSKQWIQLQNMRRKMKRKIDTRATKGRRVRYNVHNKLINFMAPITVYDTWTDIAKNELYNSLFGKIKSTEEQIKQ